MRKLNCKNKYLCIKNCISAIIFSFGLFLISCPNTAKKTDTPSKKNNTSEQFVINFAVEGSGGSIKAEVDGKSIKTGTKVQKGKTVEFTATPENNKFEVERWIGASQNEADPNKAKLIVSGAETVKVKFKNTTPTTEKFAITFGASSFGATVEAEVDGKKIDSGDEVEKGKIVTFKAKVTNDLYTVSGWSGALADETDKKTARLFVTSAKNVIVNISSPLINFIKTSGGTQKGVDSDITQEQATQILSGKSDVLVEFKGPNLSIVIGSTEKTWEADSFKVNGEKKCFCLTVHYNP